MDNTDYTAKALRNRQKRKRQVRYHTITLILSLFILITISFLFASFSTEANDLEHQPSYKYYKSVEITKGDTLWSIANDNFDSEHYKDLHEYVTEVKKLNTLSSDDIVAGNFVIVPYYAPEFVGER
ncbi:MAG: LysM peptidoglycan-binding domain-containing protein [Lachnospiraceae bacterium]|jgi:LysM repeat protein|nr:LysM peptidoglycan-binding domain-containing protein [Lachnospiraceae bacterium]MDE6942594.1 LysM peptidoglycan-binding domain-containing protein [Lachnospiraceae bacterium]MDE6989289.1 LysM peptidoglycan-binding domain-containing protein [Lachnospiraceae bacterium]MDE6999720.1 LysM peptidoglycan-binding domain-containing protein [Lachnospiraceae bacterium]